MCLVHHLRRDFQLSSQRKAVTHHVHLLRKHTARVMLKVKQEERYHLRVLNCWGTWMINLQTGQSPPKQSGSLPCTTNAESCIYSIYLYSLNKYHEYDSGLHGRPCLPHLSHSLKCHEHCIKFKLTLLYCCELLLNQF